jgi:hypothetical protein
MQKWWALLLPLVVLVGGCGTSLQKQAERAKAAEYVGSSDPAAYVGTWKAGMPPPIDYEIVVVLRQDGTGSENLWDGSHEFRWQLQGNQAVAWSQAGGRQMKLTCLVSKDGKYLSFTHEASKSSGHTRDTTSGSGYLVKE